MKHTKESHAKYLASDHWQKTRRKRLQSVNVSCNRCKMPRWLSEIVYGQDLHVHHLHYRTKGHEGNEDLEVLCARCHEIETFGRSELKEIKTAKCSLCGKVHHNYRSDLCIACWHITIMPDAVGLMLTRALDSDGLHTADIEAILQILKVWVQQGDPKIENLLSRVVAIARREVAEESSRG